MIACAECGCLVDRGTRLGACANAECCCAALPVQTMETLATKVRDAMESADLMAIGELLAPDARWGAPEQEVPTCRNARQILEWYEVARDNGVRADVTELDVVGDRLVVGLKIRANSGGPANPSDGVRWQVLTVENGRIAEIRGYETRGEANEFAASGVSKWRGSHRRRFIARVADDVARATRHEKSLKRGGP